MTDFLSFGEIMLRLRTNGYERFFQSPAFEATFGGGEANVAVSLCNYGLDAGFISALPDNDIGQSAINSLRALGVNTEHVRRSGERVGIYYLETGANQRASKVIYDRAASSICEAKVGDFDWPTIFKGAKWLHITGITPALSQGSADLSPMKKTARSLSAFLSTLMSKAALAISTCLNMKSCLRKFSIFIRAWTPSRLRFARPSTPISMAGPLVCVTAKMASCPPRNMS